MTTSDNHKAAALAAIQALRSAAVHGDTAAAATLLEIATNATSHVAALVGHVDTDRAEALNRLAGVAGTWPVNIPAIEERRQQTVDAALPAWFGLTGPVRTTRGKTKPRDFDPGTRTGFTAGVVGDLMSENRFPYGGSADKIVDACMEMLERDCQGDWESFPWPPKLKEDAEAEQNRTDPTRYVVRKWITAGVKSLSW